MTLQVTCPQRQWKATVHCYVHKYTTSKSGPSNAAQHYGANCVYVIAVEFQIAVSQTKEHLTAQQTMWQEKQIWTEENFFNISKGNAMSHVKRVLKMGPKTMQLQMVYQKNKTRNPKFHVLALFYVFFELRRAGCAVVRTWCKWDEPYNWWAWLLIVSAAPDHGGGRGGVVGVVAKRSVVLADVGYQLDSYATLYSRCSCWQCRREVPFSLSNWS